MLPIHLSEHRFKTNSHTTEPSINSAIRSGYFQQIRFLIELGHSVNGRDEEKRVPLMNCSLVENESWGLGLARLLLEKGANLKLRDSHGLNCLHYACIFERSQLVDVFLGAADFGLNQKDYLGNSALHYAVAAGNIKITQMLLSALSKYKQTVDSRNNSGITPLLQAWKSGHPDCARLLVETGDANQDIVDPSDNKSARDWEIEELAKANCASRESLKSVASSNSENIPRYMRPVHSARKRNTTRARSAPPGGRAKANRNPSGKSNEDLSGSKMNLVCKETLSNRLYKNADMKNPRNIPECVFRVSPRECFVEEQRHQAIDHKSILARTDMTSSSIAPDTFVYSGWKEDLKDLLTSNDFQWTNSYRKSIVPKPTPITCIYVSRNYDEMPDRPTTPLSDSDELSVFSDRYSMRRPGKRVNAMKNVHNVIGSFGDISQKGANQSSRRSSILSVPSRSRKGSVTTISSIAMLHSNVSSLCEGGNRKKSKSKKE